MKGRPPGLSGLKVIDHRMIPSPQKQFIEPQVLTEEQYRKIVSVIPVGRLYGARDLAQISLLHDTGMRVGELLSLNTQDIDVETKHVTRNGAVLYRGTVRTEKMRSKLPFRQVFWLEEANRNLKNWLHIREILLKRHSQRSFDTSALFLGATANGLGRRPRPAAVCNAVRRYAAKAGIKERIHPHMFRHAFARSRVLGGANTSAIASLLGHANIESSGIYTRLYGKQLEDAYTHFMPSDVGL